MDQLLESMQAYSKMVRGAGEREKQRRRASAHQLGHQLV